MGKNWRKKMIAAVVVLMAAVLLCTACCRMCRTPAVSAAATADGSGRVSLLETGSATAEQAPPPAPPPALPVAVLSGTPEQTGKQAGELLAPQIRTILSLVRLSPQFHLTGKEAALLEANIPAAHLAELEAMARAAGVDRNRLVSANVALDTLCSALVTGADGKGPVRVGRNMDFFPGGLLGPATVLAVRRQPGLHAFAAVTWPGYGGVVTGMNDAGVTVAILQNYGSPKEPRAGTPAAFRAREILETAGTLEEAAACFRSGPVASCHFLLLADAKNACVVWQDAEGDFHRQNAANGWLAWSNGKPDAQQRQHDGRAERLAALIAAPPPPERVTDAWLRATITGVRLKAINAQVMLLNPAALTLDLARARPFRSAGTQPWLRVELKPLLGK